MARGRGSTYSLTWELNVTDPHRSGSRMVAQQRELRSELALNERQHRTTSAAATTAYRREEAAAARVERAELSLRREKLRVEEAQGRLNVATGKYGRESMQARKAALALETAHHRLSVQTDKARQSVMALEGAEQREGRTAQLVASRRRRAAAAVGRGAARGIGGAAGVAGAMASRAGYGLLGAGVAGAYGAARFGRFAAEEYQESRLTRSATKAVVKSTGGVANVSVGDVDRLSTRLSRLSAVDDEVIAKSANLLLTFKNVRNEAGAGGRVFDRTEKAALNMAAGMTAAGKSMSFSTASMQLGKALQNPEKGLTRLTRIGIEFTDQQREQVTAMMKANDVAGAQKVILGEVESQFAGQARAARTPIAMLRTNFANLAEDVGKLGAPTANRGLKAIATFVEDADRNLGRKKLSISDRLGLTVKDARKDLGPFVSEIGQALEDAHLDKRLGDGIEKALPVIADHMADAAPHAARVFIHSFTAMGPWGQLLTATWLIKKMGGFKLAGKAAAGIFAGGFSGGLGGRGGGIVGTAASATRPIPVFVTNTGFGSGGPGGTSPMVTGEGATKGSRAGRVARGAVRYALPVAIGVEAMRAIRDLSPTHRDDLTGLTVGGGTHGSGQDRTNRSIHDIANRTKSQADLTSSIRATREELRQLNAEEDRYIRQAGGAGVAPQRAGQTSDPGRKDFDERRAALQRLLATLKDAQQAPRPLTKALALTAGRVTELRTRLGGLKRGTDEYKTTAGQLRDAQRDLNAALRGGATGFTGVGDSASTAASTMDSAADRISARVDQLADKLAAHGINFTPARTARGRRRQDIVFGDLAAPGLRRGGRVPAFSTGGMVPAFVSSGEMIVEPGGRRWTVPGQPTAADNVLAHLPIGASVLTWDGQARMAAGASLGSALAFQAPHFREGGRLNAGQMASLSWRQGKVRPEGDAIALGAIGMRESRGNRRARLNNPPIEDSRGWAQVNILAHKKYAGWNLYDPAIEATAVGEIHRRYGLAPWRGPSYAQWLPAARRGFRKDGSNLTGIGGIGSSDRTRKVPLRLGRSHTRGGLLDDAFGSALDAARAGAPIGRWALLDQVGEALASVTTTRDLTVRGARGGADARTRRMAKFAGAASRRFPRYVYGGGHASFTGPYDCSGFVSAILHAGGLTSRTMTTDQLKGYGQSGAGRMITIGVRGSTGTGAHTMMKLGRSYWEAGAHGVGRRSGWSGSFPIKRHPRGYARGGVVGMPPGIRSRLRRPGAHDPRSANFVGYGLGTGGPVSFGGHSFDPRSAGPVSPRIGVAPILAAGKGQVSTELARFGSLVENAAAGQIERLRAQLARAVRRGGDAKVVSRLQAALSIVDDALGARIGRILLAVDRSRAKVERRQRASEILSRAGGIEPSSTTGLQIQMAGDRAAAQTARRNVSRLARARAKALRAGQRGQAQSIAQELADARLDVADATATRLEHRRDLRRQRAQDRADVADVGYQAAQGRFSSFEISQRVTRSTDTPDGMRARASEILATLVPGLTGQRDALTNQARVAFATGDVAGGRQALLAVQQAGNDIASAMADAAELVRDAALQSAQDLVDSAQHGETMKSLGLAKLELEQRIAGTYDAGGQQRSDFIRGEIIPALRAELTALQGQQQTAQQQGDSKLAGQIAEAIAGKQNDILQATLDATEQVAANTEPRKFGGSLGYQFGGSTITDALDDIGG